MSPTSPLHEHDSTHLGDGSFSDYVAERVHSEADVLVAAPDAESREEIAAEMRNVSEFSDNVTSYAGDQTAVPHEPDTFDIAVQWNPGRGVLQRHVPLYEMVSVVRAQGTILYRAPNYLAESDAVELQELQVLNWADNGDPVIAATLEVEAAGDPREAPTALTGEAPAEMQKTTVSDFRA
jgi:hypothetical protein